MNSREHHGISKSHYPKSPSGKIYFESSYTQAKLLSTQSKIEIEYTFMLDLLNKMMTEEVVSIE